jgi:CHAD domain-containing protein
VDYAEWGRELGVVRDIEVRAGIAAELLTRARIDDGTVRRRLVDEERVAYAQAHARLVERAQGPKAASRAGMLRTFVVAPGFSDPDAAADRVVVRVLRDQERRVRRAVHRLDGTEEAYHAVRKAARRLRYVAEAGADDAFPLPGAADLARVGEVLHDLLGEHRDALLVADRIAHQRTAAVRAGEPGDPYARVEALARADAADRLTELPEALRSLRQARSGLG